MNFVRIDWHALLLAGAGVALAAGGFVAWWRRRPRDPDEMERERRGYLNRVGRIVEGHVVEILEAPREELVPARRGLRPPTIGVNPPLRIANGSRPLVHYAYSISGVSYETAQDVTGLEARAQLDRIVAGQLASVKYDPANPSNSILIADDWSGLH